MPRERRGLTIGRKREAREKRERRQQEELNIQRRLADAAEQGLSLQASVVDATRDESRIRDQLANFADQTAVSQREFANAAKDSARWLRRQVIVAGTAAFLTLAAVIVAIQATRATENALRIETRPWLSVDIEFKEIIPFRATYPMHWVRYTETLHNYGPTPAVSVAIATRLRAHPDTLAPLADDIRGLCEEAHRFARGEPRNSDATTVWATNVFPDEKAAEVRNISRNWADWGEIPTDDRQMQITLLGCVHYESSRTGETGETPFAFDFWNVINCDSVPDFRDPFSTQQLRLFKQLEVSSVFYSARGASSNELGPDAPFCFRPTQGLNLVPK
jgi:hypothetical protein